MQSAELEPTPEQARAAIDEHRGRIDELDAQIVALMNERAKESLSIRKLKPFCKMDLYDPGREERIFERNAELGKGPLSGEDLRRIYETLLKVMKECKA